MQSLADGVRGTAPALVGQLYPSPGDSVADAPLGEPPLRMVGLLCEIAPAREES